MRGYFRTARPLAAKPIYPATGFRRQTELPVFGQPFARRRPPQHTRDKNCSDGFDYGWWSFAHNVRQAHVRNFIAQADRVRESGIGVKLNDELRRATAAAQSRVQPMKEL